MQELLRRNCALRQSWDPASHTPHITGVDPDPRLLNFVLETECARLGGRKLLYGLCFESCFAVTACLVLTMVRVFRHRYSQLYSGEHTFWYVHTTPQNTVLAQFSSSRKYISTHDSSRAGGAMTRTNTMNFGVNTVQTVGCQIFTQRSTFSLPTPAPDLSSGYPRHGWRDSLPRRDTRQSNGGL